MSAPFVADASKACLQVNAAGVAVHAAHSDCSAQAEMSIDSSTYGVRDPVIQRSLKMFGGGQNVHGLFKAQHGDHNDQGEGS